MIEAIGAVRKAANGYGRQQFYADRAQKLSVKKTFQIGLEDRVTFSPEAEIRVAQSAQTATAKSSTRGGEIAYEDPRKAVRAQLTKVRATELDNEFVVSAEEIDETVDREDEFAPGLAVVE